ncbi:hypothetical protein [Iodobacter sp.]|uniref:hypothetical protein n=1 Tax=Iodobacter sp. TaxID=1915058 RepID=UPI0025FB02E5|nr:hypothetical protein [Iodobacter sp.]
MRNMPIADFNVTTTELIFAISTKPESELAEILGTSPRQINRWQTGQDPIPRSIFLLARFYTSGIVPFGEWKDWTLAEQCLIPPHGNKKGCARIEEILFIDHYRKDRMLCNSQYTLIESLIKQRNFYKNQCSLEAKYGLMLATVFREKDPPAPSTQPY